MGIYLSKEKKKEIFEEYGGSPDNTGSTEGQIALFTYRIKGLSEHLLDNEGDTSARKKLLELVGQRRNKLKYLASKDIEKYRELLDKLELRK